MLTDMFDKLAEPFPAEVVSWRVGSKDKEATKGLALAYLDARDVMERLDFVCGPGGWQNRYSHANGKTVCDIGLKIDGEWIWKADGAGDTDVEAEKGALSDAFKRAAVRWGVGRYLYALPSPWVEIEPMGRSHKIKDGEHRKLETLLRNFSTQHRKSSASANRDKEQANVADAPPPPSALDVAMSQLIGATSAEDFAAIWSKLKAGAPNVMSKAEYAQLVDFMKREAERWKPPQATAQTTSAPITETRSFAMNEDEIPF